jgi:hypothetical protein
MRILFYFPKVAGNTSPSLKSLITSWTVIKIVRNCLDSLHICAIVLSPFEITVFDSNIGLSEHALMIVAAHLSLSNVPGPAIPDLFQALVPPDFFCRSYEAQIVPF